MIEIKDGATSLATFTYDGLGRRIRKIDKAPNPDVTTLYYHNNNWQVLCETDENELQQRYYIYGNYIDEPVMMVDDDSGDEYYYVHDHLFSTVALVLDSGVVVERYEYDAYGKPTIYNAAFTQTYTESQYDNPYLYTARYFENLDSDGLQLQYNRYRYFDFDSGRWLTPDPLGTTPGAIFPDLFSPVGQMKEGLNYYEYASSKVDIQSDPYGLWAYDFHFYRTFTIAGKAGMNFAMDVGNWANSPDHGLQNPYLGVAFKTLGEVLAFVKKNPLFKKGGDAYIDWVAYWHFPGADKNQPVKPGSVYARREVKEGIALCNLEVFSKGLHQLQDSYAHQTFGSKLPPIYNREGHSRDRFGWNHEHWDDIRVLSQFIPESVFRSTEWYLLSNETKEKIMKTMRIMQVALSTDADDTALFWGSARSAATSTYNAMTLFMKRCPCIKMGPYAGLPSRKRDPVERDNFREYLRRTFEDPSEEQ